MHARAFRDEEMRDLSMYALLATHDPKHSEWRPIAQQLYGVSRARWVGHISNSRDAITDILNLFCDLMYNLVFVGCPSLLPNE